MAIFSQIQFDTQFRSAWKSALASRAGKLQAAAEFAMRVQKVHACQ